MKYSILLLILILIISISNLVYCQGVRTGAEVFIEKYIDSLSDFRLGIICNHTSVLPNGTHIVDTLLKKGIKITALFASEHGIRGKSLRGIPINDTIDEKTGLKVFSLYGGIKKPTPDMLSNIDVLVFDMQDVGARFYTYASTMAYCIIAAAENGKKFYVLDRPNPVNGVQIEGPVLDMSLISFFGLMPIPVRHGMTLGELARMAVGEGYLNPSNVDLVIVPMQNWKREMWYDETGLPWIAPSPNMISLSTAIVYPGTCLFEATNISEGRGTQKPFEYIGAPKIDGKLFSQRLNKLGLPGVSFSTVIFTPKSDSLREKNPKFENLRCEGVYVNVTDRNEFKPVLTGIMMINTLLKLYPKKFQLRKGLFNHLVGDELVAELLESGKFDKNSTNIFNGQIRQFENIRSKYLLY